MPKAGEKRAGKIFSSERLDLPIALKFCQQLSILSLPKKIPSVVGNSAPSQPMHVGKGEEVEFSFLV
jgi:hypothetical protein